MKAIKWAQNDIQKEKKIKDTIWSYIAKAVDNVIGLKDLISIQAG